VVLAVKPIYEPPILTRGRSDAEGRFTLEHPADFAGQTTIIATTVWLVKANGSPFVFTIGDSDRPSPREEPLLARTGQPARIGVSRVYKLTAFNACAG
jgi:hypothetical protein